MKSADESQPNHITSSHVPVEETTPAPTLAPCAELTIESITTEDTELSRDLTEIESMQFEDTLDSLLSTGVELQAAVIENVAKAKDGGFQVLLSVSETDAKSVGKLLADLQSVYHILLVPHD